MISLFTGLSPSVHGIETRGQSLTHGTNTIFDVFKRHGYLVPDIAYLSNIPNFTNLGLDPKEVKYLKNTTLPGDELIGWLSDHKDGRFFVWYHYRFLHLPYNPQNEFNIFLDSKGIDLLDSVAIKKVRSQGVIPFKSISFTKDQQSAVNDLYDGQLRELDSFIKRLYEKMVQLDLHNNTLLVITADHGEELFEHGFIGHASTAIHATMYDEVLKIPLIFHSSCCLDGGVVIKDQVRQIDIMPTILDIAGLNIPDSVQGVSLLPLIKGDTDMTMPPAISESIMGGYQSTPELEKIKLHSIRTANWKLVRLFEGNKYEFQLFNLSEDPAETNNLISKKHKTASKLKEQLSNILGDMQIRRFVMQGNEKTTLSTADIPKGAILEKPGILLPVNGSALKIDESGQIKLQWTGNKRFAYVIEYDVGEGWRNLKGKIPVYGNIKVFGPLPQEAREPLAYWNPFRIRISPYGSEKYWSDWTEFFIEKKEAP
jgi:arylsulfatase A-like enzyme